MRGQIPKKIHYCWFGGKPLSDEAKRNIESWRKYCPDYEIIRWDENNFDVNSNQYVREAYSAAKWAFVTDYVRLFVLYNNGGIYMDTDVELVAPLDCFLKHDAFSGFESNSSISTCIMACKKRFKLFGELMDYYDDKHFSREDGSLNMTTNVSIITDICRKHGFVSNNKLQNIDGFVLYPSDVFCPKDPNSGIIHMTDSTVAIHHFAGSWLNKDALKLVALRERLCRKYNSKVGIILYKTVYVPYRFYIHVRMHGFKGALLELTNKKS